PAAGAPAAAGGQGHPHAPVPARPRDPPRLGVTAPPAPPASVPVVAAGAATAVDAAFAVVSSVGFAV
ncbi:hypothetical protein ACFRFO_37195, partial [Streptomyces sp. NPDC056664]